MSHLNSANKGDPTMRDWKSGVVVLVWAAATSGVALAVSPGQPIKDAFNEVSSLKPLLVGVFSLITIYGGLLWAFSDNPQSVGRGKRIVMGAIGLGLGLLLLQQVGAPITDAIKKFLDGGLLGVSDSR